MSNLTNFVKGLTSGSRLMQGREKVVTDDVVGIALTMRDFEMLTGNDGKKFPVIIFDEMPEKYYTGGKVLTEICEGIENGGFHDELAQDGLKIMLGVKLTKAHKPCVIVTVLD